jgi:hypothetical protein
MGMIRSATSAYIINRTIVRIIFEIISYIYEEKEMWIPLVSIPFSPAWEAQASRFQNTQLLPRRHLGRGNSFACAIDKNCLLWRGKETVRQKIVNEN